MDSNLSYIDSVRKGALSLRGGVRVRGGRLPPIRIGNVTVLSANKKTFTPNIPQRRIKVKQGVLDPAESCSYQESPGNGKTRGRGRGRGQKVYLQTEGSFLGEGPALRTKKELQTTFYDRSCYVSSSRAKTVAQVKVDSSKIDELLKNYDEKETFLDSDFKPVRLPLPKLEKSGELKSSIQKDIKTEGIKTEGIKTEGIKTEGIKTEDIKTEDIKPFIKQEPIDDDNEWNTLVDKYSIKIKKEKDLDVKGHDFHKDFKLFQDENELLLLQFPSFLPFQKACDLPIKEKSLPEKNSDNVIEVKEESGISIKDLSDGHVGRLQVMKSGHMRIMIGSVALALEHGVDSQSKWEAASIPIDNKNGDLIMLGKIGFKMVLRPHLKYIMKRPLEKDVCIGKSFYT